MAQQALPYTLPDIPNNEAWKRTGEMFTDLYSLQSQILSAGDSRFANSVLYPTVESKIEAMLTQCEVELKTIGAIPASMIPHDTTLIGTHPTVRRVREGGDYSVYDAEAYGADPATVIISTAAVQAAVTAGAAARGVTKLSHLYLTDAPIVCPDYTTILGNGVGTGVRCGPTHTSTPFINSNTSTGNININLKNFEVDGNKANRTAGNNLIHFTCAEGQNNRNIHIQDVYAHDSKGTAGVNGLGIVLSRVHGGSVHRCHVSGNERDGITFFFDCQDLFISSNWVHDIGDDFIGLNAENGSSTGHLMTRIVVSDNILGPGGTSQGSGIAVRGVTHASIHDNILTEPFHSGILVTNYNTTESVDVDVHDNVVADAGLHNTSPNGVGITVIGAQVESSVFGVAGARRIKIHDNFVLLARSFGIRVLNNNTGVTVQDVTIENNEVVCSSLYASGSGIIGDVGPCTDITIRNNTVWDAQVQGVNFNDTVHPYKRLKFVGNRVYNSGNATGSGSSSSVGISVTGAEDVEFFFNTCTDLRAGGAKTTRNGIRFASCTGTIQMVGNDCDDNGTANGYSLNNTSSLDRFVWDAKPGVSPDRGDASVTLIPGQDFETQRFATILTANRTVTLSSTATGNSTKFRITRTGLGSFTLDVGGLKTIPSGTAAVVDVEHDGTAWRLTGYSLL